VVTVREAPVSISFADIETPETTAPEGSVTVPEILAETWA